jgi:hypothetical protein
MLRNAREVLCGKTAGSSWNPVFIPAPATPNMLSVNGVACPSSGTGSCGAVVQGTQSTFTFTYDDPINGATNIQYGAVWLEDGSGGIHCQSQWGNNNLFYLWDASPDSSANGGTLTDSFCRISMAPFDITGASTANVTLNVAFLAGAVGTYTIWSSVYDSDGAESPHGELGTITVGAPLAYAIGGQVTGGGAGISGITVQFRKSLHENAAASLKARAEHRRERGQL